MTFRITPDGRRYLAMGKREPQPMPFHLRWLVPWLLGEHLMAWVVMTALSILCASALTGVLAWQHGATTTQAVCAALLFLGLPAMRFAWGAPVLLDGVGIACALGAAVLWFVDPRLSIAAALLGGAVSEKVPVFAALFAWQPLLLCGLAAPVARWLFVRHAQISDSDPLKATLESPVAASLEAHHARWRDPLLMVTPWGACLLCLASPSAWIVTALAIGYAQLLVATDSVRLYQQVAPVLCVSAAMIVPTEWVAALLVAHWFNPLAGNGL